LIRAIKTREKKEITFKWIR